jgi:hypothetical protein
MAAMSQMQGARLEFVVREIKGDVQRPVHAFDKKKLKIVQQVKSQPGGYLVYFPSGQSYRLTRKELMRRGFDRQPSIMNFDQVKDTKSPAGQYKFAMSDEQRREAWAKLENEVIKACVRKHGPIMNKESEHVEQAA